MNMNLVSLAFVRIRLKISRNRCWELIGAGNKGLVSDQKVIDILNAHRRNMPMLDFIPGNLLTVEEAGEMIMFNGEATGRRKLLRWINDPTRKIPHIKLNDYLIRLPKDALIDWYWENYA